jgi:hypothetical protein
MNSFVPDPYDGQIVDISDEEWNDYHHLATISTMQQWHVQLLYLGNVSPM